MVATLINSPEGTLLVIKTVIAPNRRDDTSKNRIGHRISSPRAKKLKTEEIFAVTGYCVFLLLAERGT